MEFETKFFRGRARLRKELSELEQKLESQGGYLSQDLENFY